MLERRVPLRAKKPWPLTRTRIRPRSTKQAKKDREFTKARREVLERDEHTCQLVGLMDGHHCTGRLEVHHVRRRSQGGTNDPLNLICVCAEAHRFIHDNPAEAALFGLLDLRKEDLT